MQEYESLETLHSVKMFSIWVPNLTVSLKCKGQHKKDPRRFLKQRKILACPYFIVFGETWNGEESVTKSEQGKVGHGKLQTLTPLKSSPPKTEFLC